MHLLIASDECHAWFHLKAASPAEKNTEQVNITQKLSTVGFEPQRQHGLQITSRPSLPIGQFSNVTIGRN